MISLVRNIFSPVRLFGADNELMKKLIGFLSAALYVEDYQLIAKLFHEKFYPLRNKLPLSVAFLFLIKKISPQMLAKTIFLSINIFAGTFVAGNGFKAIMKKAEAYRKRGFLVNFDILGETVLSEEEARRYQLAYLKFIKEIGPRLPPNALSVSLKGSAFYSQFNSCSPEYSSEKILKRLTPIMETIINHGGHAYLDAEDYEFREIQFIVFEKMYKQFGGSARCVLQSYLRTSEDTLDRLFAINNPKDPIWIRVVRGAYWDFECYKAELMNWPLPPVYLEKSETDAAFEMIIKKGWSYGLNMIPATHNVKSICLAEENSLAIKKPIPEVQLLYGIGESIGKYLSLKNIPVRFYMPVQYPYGKLHEAGGYLIRRISESQLSFVLKGFMDISSEDKRLLYNLNKRRRQ